MKAHIYWIYFDNKEIHNYIRNSTNTDNWPTVKKYGQIIEEFKQKIEEQKKDEERIENIPEKVKKLINNLQIAFHKEHSLLTNPNIANTRSYKQKDLEPYLKEEKFANFKNFIDEFGSDIEEGGISIKLLII